jgi:low affinity Fe/Cu permease
MKNQLFTELVRIVQDKIQPHLRLCMAARIHRSLERLAEKATKYAGSSSAFAGAVAVVAVWLLTGPLFKFSDTWQLVINTGTTIVTFLMVFLIQRTQNKETQAIQLKLNELVAALKGASNRLIDLEDWTEEELWNLHQHYRRLAELARESQDTHRSLSVDSAEARHKSKHSGTDKSAA